MGTKVIELFRQHIPCPVCGNSDVRMFQLIGQGLANPEVYCLECKTNLSKEEK